MFVKWKPDPSSLRCYETFALTFDPKWEAYTCKPFHLSLMAILSPAYIDSQECVRNFDIS